MPNSHRRQVGTRALALVAACAAVHVLALALAGSGWAQVRERPPVRSASDSVHVLPPVYGSVDTRPRHGACADLARDHRALRRGRAAPSWRAIRT